MADAEPDDVALKKGTAELLVLAQLEGRPRHGYEIAQQIAARAAAASRFSPPRSIPSSTGWSGAGSSPAGGWRKPASGGAATTG